MSYDAPNSKVKLRRLTATEWGNNKIRLSDGEPGYDTTNNIFKIGLGNKLWKDLPPIGGGSDPFFNSPPAITGLSYVTSPNGNLDYVDIRWDYPQQEPVGFVSSTFPLLVNLNAYIVTGTSRTSLNTDGVSAFITNSRTAGLTRIRLYARQPPTQNSNNIVLIENGVRFFTYYSVALINSVSSIEIWYSNYDEFPNKVTKVLPSFSVSPGPPAPPTGIDVTTTPSLHFFVIKFTPPTVKNTTFPLDPLATLLGYRIIVNDGSNEIINYPFLDSEVGTTQSAVVFKTGNRYTYQSNTSALENTRYYIFITASNNYRDSQNNFRLSIPGTFTYDSGNLVNPLPPTKPEVTNISTVISTSPKRVVVQFTGSTLTDIYDTRQIVYVPIVSATYQGASDTNFTISPITTLTSNDSISIIPTSGSTIRSKTYTVIVNATAGTTETPSDPVSITALALSLYYWNSITTYEIDDQVLHNSVYYQCIESSTNNEPDTQSTYWTRLGSEYYRPGAPSVPTVSASINDMISETPITFVADSPTVWNVNDSEENAEGRSFTYSISVRKREANTNNQFSDVNSASITQQNPPVPGTFLINIPDVDLEYQYRYTVRNNHTTLSASTQWNSIDTVGLVYKAPPSAPRNLTVTQDRNNGTPCLKISFRAPQYANSGTTTDRNAVIQSYKLDISGESSSLVLSPNQFTLLDGIYSYNHSPIVQFTDYTVSVYARNQYLTTYSESTSTSITTDSLVLPGPPPNTGTLTWTTIGFGIDPSPILRISFVPCTHGNVNGSDDPIAITNYTIVITVQSVTQASPPVLIVGTATTTSENIFLYTEYDIFAESYKKYTVSIIATNAYPSNNSTTTTYINNTYTTGLLRQIGLPSPITVGNLYVAQPNNTANPTNYTSLNAYSVDRTNLRVIVPFTPPTYANSADTTDTSTMSYSIAVTTSSGTNITPPTRFSTFNYFVLPLVENSSYSGTITATNSYYRYSSVTFTRSIPQGPPGLPTSITTSNAPYWDFSYISSNENLSFGWSIPRYNAYFSNDTTSSPALTYTFSLTNPVLVLSNTEPTIIANRSIRWIPNTTYQGTIVTTNGWSKTSSTSFSFQTGGLTTILYANLAPAPLVSNNYYSSAFQGTSTSDGTGGLTFTKSAQSITNVLKTSHQATVATGMIPVGTFNIRGTRTSNTLTFTSSSTSATSSLGIFPSTSGFGEFLANSPATTNDNYGANINRYLMSNNTIKININTTTYPPSSQALQIQLYSNGNLACSYPDFYTTALLSGGPTDLIGTITISESATKYISKVLIRPTATISATVSAKNLGDYFFPAWSAQITAFGNTSEFDISSFRLSGDVFTLRTPVNQTVSLYSGSYSGTFTLQNINNTAQTTSSSTSVTIDNASFNFDPTGHIATIVVALPSIALSTTSAYNHSSTGAGDTLSGSDLLIYNGKFRTPANLPSNEIRNAYSYPSSGAYRYATFKTSVRFANLSSDSFNITLNNIEGILSITNKVCSLSDGTPLRVLYRFQCTSTQYQYTTKWLSANERIGGTVGSSPASYYATTTDSYAGPTSVTLSNNSLVFTGCFQPNINNLPSRSTGGIDLFITIGANPVSTFAFSGVSNSFV